MNQTTIPIILLDPAKVRCRHDPKLQALRPWHDTLVLLLFEVGYLHNPPRIALACILHEIYTTQHLHHESFTLPTQTHRSTQLKPSRHHVSIQQNTKRQESCLVATNRKAEMERLHRDRWKRRHHFAKTQTFRYVFRLGKKDGAWKQWHVKTDVLPTKVSCRGCRFLLPGQTSKTSACAAPGFDGEQAANPGCLGVQVEVSTNIQTSGSDRRHCTENAALRGRVRQQVRTRASSAHFVFHISHIWAQLNGRHTVFMFRLQSANFGAASGDQDPRSLRRYRRARFRRRRIRLRGTSKSTSITVAR